MTDNTENINGVEIYVHQFFELADQYIDERLQGKEKDVPNSFRDMIYYLADRIEKPDNADIKSLDCLFGAYVRLCAHYHRLPTLECFSWLIGADRRMFTSWNNGEHRASTAHGDTVKKWLAICKGFVVDELSNTKFANPNLIFTAKAAYGMRETSPIPAETENKRVLTASELPKLGRMNDNEKMILPDLTE